ncbi:hypothetical protein [Sediminibacillus sp. JSM 1682029]|uniref:hypothetical protein n=1 Tax=Sediminibacillus sp. JSM 1682029 TaxID=3229857 RepID=UPI0035237C13
MFENQIRATLPDEDEQKPRINPDKEDQLDRKEERLPWKAERKSGKEDQLVRKEERLPWKAERKSGKEDQLE